MDGLTIETALLASYATSGEAYKQTEELRKFLGFSARAPIARMSIGRSLGETAPPPKPPDTRGKGIKGDTLFGVDEFPLWMALLVTNLRTCFPQKDVTSANVQALVACHWHRGISLLMDDWNEAEGGYKKFVEMLITRRAVLPDRLGGNATPIAETLSSGAVNIKIGKEEGNGEPFAWTVNGVGYSPHIAIMGQVGSGKTRTMLEAILQMHRQTQAPVLLLDLGKGELADNAELARELGAEVLRVPQNPIGLDMFHGSCASEDIASDTVLGFRDSLTKVMQSRPGGKQLDHIREALKPLFSRNVRISMEGVRDCLKNYYEENEINIDSVISAINDLTERTIFRPEIAPADFFSRSWIITFGQARDTVKNLAAYLLLDALNVFLKNLQEASRDSEGHRAIRLILAVDEAKNLLASRHQGLSDNIRLHRSKGLVVLLASQSPDDYKGAGDDYLENIGLPICFKTNAVATAVIQNMFKGKVNFAALDTGVCLTLKDGRALRVKTF